MTKRPLIEKYWFLFCVGCFVYMAMELLFRQRTHWTMGLLGGICFIELGLINEILPWKTGLIKQGIIGATIITINEFICGLIVNVWLGWNVWDYSNLPFNIMGQICLLFFFIWIFVAIFGIIVDDYIRYKRYKEELPRYFIFGKVIIPFR